MKDTCLYCGLVKEGEWTEIDINEDADSDEFVCFECQKKQVKRMEGMLETAREIFIENG